MVGYIQRLNKQDPELLVRVFIAIMFPQEMRLRLFEQIAQVKAMHHQAPLRWTSAENWHLTLAFLGRINERQCDNLLEALTRITKAQRAFQLSFSVADSFPQNASPHSLVLYPEQNEALAELQAAIAIECKRLQLPFDAKHAFLPHVTIARRQNKKLLLSQPYYFLSPVKIEVTSYALVSSRPQPTQSQYDLIGEFLLP